MLLKYIEPKKMTKEEIIDTLNKHSYIKFVSLVAVDLGNNHTDEKIPIKLFIDNYDDFMKNGIQTDGSGVNLPKIATINDGRVDLIPDSNVKWVVDYNELHTIEVYDEDYCLDLYPAGTLQIPSFLMHTNEYVDSRSILNKAIFNLKTRVMEILEKNEFHKKIGIEEITDIKDVVLTAATELEFWVRTPDETVNIEELSTSQLLKEQYWKRTEGPVRTALEKSLLALEKYGLEPEMGHKEVGGIRSRVENGNNRYHIVEQLEIDWKYDNPMQAADNEMFAKDIITDVFRQEGLDVSFDAKPLESVAGSGEHHHVGIALKMKNGKMFNLFSPDDMKTDYLSELGYGALMGILKNYEVINPFISSSTDAFNRLTPGYEAPVCIVASLGITPEIPSRNRSVLIGVIRDNQNKLATRFEMRAPNPKTNSYLCLAATYQSMVDGMTYAATKTKEELLNELRKKQNVDSDYLEKNRVYISEHDIYTKYTEKVRNTVFGKSPRNVYEAIQIMSLEKDKLKVLLKNGVFTNKIIESYKETIMSHWINELNNRILIDSADIVRSYVKRHNDDFAEVSEQDLRRWEEIRMLKWKLMKHDEHKAGVIDRMRIAIDEKDYELVSEIQKTLHEKMKLLNQLYAEYKRKLLVL